MEEASHAGFHMKEVSYVEVRHEGGITWTVTRRRPRTLDVMKEASHGLSHEGDLAP
jgi:hypothetical protein